MRFPRFNLLSCRASSASRVSAPWRLSGEWRHSPIICRFGPKRIRAVESQTVSIQDFERIDIRVGTIVDAEPFPEARKPAIKLTIDFGGEIGVRRSSAQITLHYQPETLIGRQVCAVVNFPPRRIGPFVSEVLTLGLPDPQGGVVLIRPDFKVPDGGKLF